jgi:hypothetical protein
LRANKLPFYKLNIEMAGAGAIVFAEIDGLPCAKQQSSAGDYHSGLSACQRGFYMRVRVALHMLVLWKLRERPVQRIGHVRGDIGVGVFIYGNAGCRVRAEHDCNALVYM